MSDEIKEGRYRLDLSAFDASSYLRDEGEALLYLQGCIDEDPGDAAFIAQALGTVAKARERMSTLAARTGLSRESLYKSLSGSRDPAFSTVLKVLSALGYRLHVALDDRRPVAPAAIETTTNAVQPIEVAHILTERVVARRKVQSSLTAPVLELGGESAVIRYVTKFQDLESEGTAQGDAALTAFSAGTSSSVADALGTQRSVLH